MDVMQLIESLIWLLAGVGIFIVGMNFLGDALERSAGNGMKNLLGKISNNRFSGVGIGAGVTAIIQSSSATSVMVIGLVNAGVMTLMQATPIIMGANIGTTITGVLVALKNDIFNMIMYLFAFAGVMMGFSKKDKIKLAGSLMCGLGLIFVGLDIMSSDQAFRNDQVMDMFESIFAVVNSPILMIVIGVVFTALIQSSSAATGVVITMVGTGVLPLDLALFIVLGANIGTCVTALLACAGANANSKRVALIHFTFNVIGTVIFTAIVWIFKDAFVNMLVSFFPNDNDPMSLQMRVSVFHVIFNVTTTLVLLPFVKQLVAYSQKVIKDTKVSEEKSFVLHFVDERLLSTPAVALMQVKKEIDRMFSLVEENIGYSFYSMENSEPKNTEKVVTNEAEIDFINSALTDYLIKLSAYVEPSDEKIIGGYFYVLNDLERIGDHAENFHEIGAEMNTKGLVFSDVAKGEIQGMHTLISRMTAISKDAFENLDAGVLTELSELEEQADDAKIALTASHFARLADGSCTLEASPYYSSAILGLERVADHLVNVGYSIVDPVGSQE